MHSHDTGRCVQPYGYPVATPSLQRLADQGVLFRQAFAAAPVCSGSRAALLTGEYCHTNGMLGLAHRGYRLHDYGHHIVHTLGAAGYASALIGEQHLSADPGVLGYDRVVPSDSHRAEDIAPAAVALLREGMPEPFFLSVGFFETHRRYFEPVSERDARSSLPPANLPDVAAIRRDMAGFKASARALDDGVGAVLGALEERGLAERTLVVLTTDHGLAFPGAKATLSDRGLGVMLILRGPGGFEGGGVSDALVSHVDLFPTLCELAGIEPPGWTRGCSMLPLLRGAAEAVNDAVFAEMTFHAAYEPQRAVRTKRHKYIRRFENGHRGPVLPNIDDSPSKDFMLAHGLADSELSAEALYDLLVDPSEARNLAGDAAHADVLSELGERLERWMEDTGDPLLAGPVEPLDGSELNQPGQRSAEDPTIRVGRH